MPKKRSQLGNISEDTLRLNPGIASELEEGQWAPESEVRRNADYEKEEDKKYEFLKAWHEHANGVRDPDGLTREFRPIPGRRNRCDWAWVEWKIIVEVDGGNHKVVQVKQGRNRGKWVAVGRHTKDADYWKINEITALGYAVFRFTTTQLKKEPKTCVAQVLRYMKLKGFIK